MPEEKAKRSYRKYAPPILLMIVLVLTLLSRLVDFSHLAEGENLLLTVVLLNVVIFILPGIFYSRLIGSGYITETNFRFTGLGTLPVVLFMFFVMVSGSILLNYLLYRLGWLDLLAGASAGNFSFLEEGTVYSGILQLVLSGIAFGLIPAVSEEFFFRGVLASEYARYGEAAQILIPALGFALSHFSLVQFPVYLFNGLALSFTAFITRSVFSSMILHTLYNLFALYIESFVWSLIAQRSSTVFFIFLVTTIFLLFLMLAMGEGERLFYNYAVSAVPEPKPASGKRQKGFAAEAFASPILLACMALFIIAVLLQ